MDFMWKWRYFLATAHSQRSPAEVRERKHAKEVSSLHYKEAFKMEREEGGGQF